MIKTVLVTLFIIFLMSTFSSNSFSQNSNYDRDILNSQLGDFQLKFEELMGYRGFEWFNSLDIDIATVTGALAAFNNNKTAVVFYCFQNDSLYVWALCEKGILAWTTSQISADELQNLEIGIKCSLKMNSSERGGKILYSVNSSYKPELLWKKACSVIFPTVIIDSLNAYENLIIVPALNIGSFPLYAFQPFSDNKDYVVDRKTIVLAHSWDDILNKIAYFSEIKNYCYFSELTFTSNFPLIVGNPDFEACKSEFAQLTGAEKEAVYVADKFKTALITGREATKAYVLSKLPDSDFIYFATHGVADITDPLNLSYLVLAGSGTDDCDKLTAKEIQSLELQMESIVVLSACQTGLGKTHVAGVIGLGRAFIIAGAGNVIFSLWSVDDNYTQILMQYFVDELFVEHDFFPATNLRYAILKLKEENPNPYVWAAFVSMGMPYPSRVKLKLE